MPAPSAVATRPKLGRLLARGALRKCPWCGSRKAYFTGWWEKSAACERCGLRWRRDDVGFELGAAAIAAIIVMGPIVIALGVVMLVTWPDLQAVPMMITLGISGLVLPIILYPVSYTLWQAIDIVLRPPQPEDFDHPDIAPDTGADPDPGIGSASAPSDPSS